MAAPAISASKLADVHGAAPSLAGTAPALTPTTARKERFKPSQVIRNRTPAIIELSALWREEQGWQPDQSDPAKEPLHLAREWPVLEGGERQQFEPGRGQPFVG